MIIEGNTKINTI
jgi:hypothetical protein